MLTIYQNICKSLTSTVLLFPFLCRRPKPYICDNTMTLTEFLLTRALHMHFTCDFYPPFL